MGITRDFHPLIVVRGPLLVTCDFPSGLGDRSFGCRWGGDPSLAGEGRSVSFRRFFFGRSVRLVSMFDVGASFPRLLLANKKCRGFRKGETLQKPWNIRLKYLIKYDPIFMFNFNLFLFSGWLHTFPGWVIGSELSSFMFFFGSCTAFRRCSIFDSPLGLAKTHVNKVKKAAFHGKHAKHQGCTLPETYINLWNSPWFSKIIGHPFGGQVGPIFRG